MPTVCVVNGRADLAGESRAWARRAPRCRLDMHATGERQRMIADALGDLARMELAGSQKPRRGGKASGTELAQRRGKPSERR